MPFYHAAGPNAAVGLLRAIAERAGFPTDSYHLNLDLATRLDEALHEALCRNHHNLMCEWLFAVAAFGEEADSDEAGYLSAYPEVLEVFGRLGRDRATVSQLRNDILPRFIDDCVGAADWGRYRVVAFTSTFQQNVASLALARRIKARWPAVAIVFGGSNMQGEAGEEYMRAFPFIDYVVTGDGDTAFPALLGAIASGTAPDGVPGLLFRSAGGIQRSAPAELFQDLDALPTPDYEEFFARAQRLGLLGQPKVGWMLPFEASRGCWWGARHQCTFCGFARDGIRYRSKTPARIFDELCELARKHAICTFSAADSIMDLRCVKGFFDKVHESRADFVFFWETKSNLTREQIATMHRGGLRQIQPGIESLSTNVLRLMNKGATMLQNVRCMKWASYYGVAVAWNLLRGFPGEREEDYRRQLEVLKLLSHLDPPNSCGPVWLERFSPYFANREGLPITGQRPRSYYRRVYPRTVADDRVAFTFDAEFGDTVPAGMHAPMLEWIEEWRRRRASARPAFLVFRQAPGLLIIDDGRGGDGHVITYTYRGPVAAIYAECVETMRRPGDVTAALARQDASLAGRERDVEAALDEFCRRGLMVGEDGWYLALAQPQNPHW